MPNILIHVVNFTISTSYVSNIVIEKLRVVVGMFNKSYKMFPKLTNYESIRGFLRILVVVLSDRIILWYSDSLIIYLF